MNKNFYITTTLPYANAVPHLGFAAEIVRADVMARFAKKQGQEVFFNTGTDEHGLKMLQKAEELGKDITQYCDECSKHFLSLKETLNLSFNSFVRTTDDSHQKAAQEFWKRCFANGDIYKKEYKVKYCAGCELEKTDSELVSGKCPLHPNRDIENIEEENYFFRLSKYQDRLLDFYDKNPSLVVPDFRFNEIKSFVKNGLEDFSISRLKEKMPWGVPVPGDDKQVMYVWFDALVNYISVLGWPDESKGSDFAKFWPGIQVCGKDNLRQQTAIWQAMLMSVGLSTSRQILVFGFISSDGQKMSKSLGNVVDPVDLVKEYGTDTVRYYISRGLQAFADSDYSQEKFETLYNADLANGLGNLVARVATLLEKNEIEINLSLANDIALKEAFDAKMDTYSFDEALGVLWNKIRKSDEILSEAKPWKMEDKNEIKKVLEPIAQNILNIADLLEIFMPETAEKIKTQFSSSVVKKGEPLFPRV